MPQCCADGCFSRQVKGKVFHLLPSGKSDSVRRAEWIRRIGRECWTPNRNTRLCEDHFTPDQYEQHRIDGKRKLKCNAVPSIFMRYIDVKSHQLTANRNSLIDNMGSDTLCMGDGPSSTNNDPFPEESYIIPDAPSSTNNDPSIESHIILDAPCSVDFLGTKSPRPIPEYSFDIEKQELL